MMNYVKCIFYFGLMIPVTELDAGFLLEESFESGQHPFLTSGNEPEVIAATETRSGSYISKSQLTPNSVDPERTEASLRPDPDWNFNPDQEYWVGISIKLDEDFNDDAAFNDQGVLLQLHYYDWKHDDGFQPQPFVLRYQDKVIKVQYEQVVDSKSSSVTIGQLPVQIGEWVDWVFRIKLSDTNGIFQVWRNGALEVNWTGDNHL